jgi:hypothetical protein
MRGERIFCLAANEVGATGGWRTGQENVKLIESEPTRRQAGKPDIGRDE